MSEKSKVAEKEETVLKFWKDNNIFEKTLAKPSRNGNFVFYDGPPFATGLPHYGHILASTIKDAIPRYKTMRGYHVERRWGWDCHGLPIENIVEKDLKISGKKEIEEYGVEKFNEYARSKVLDFVHDWKKTVERIGRWVDFDGSYKTMDNTFIESVWWGLKQIWEKGLIYEGTKVLPYCPRCETPIANSEIAMDNSYKDITDISVYVKFELVDEPGTYLLAWTTTPWTLPGNTAAAVNPSLSYVKVKIGNEHFILAKERLSILKNQPFEIMNEFKGETLVGKSYKPIFDYFLKANLKNRENGWKVYAALYVTAESGSGIVHLAPAYGEEDMELAKKQNIPVIRHVGNDGKFVAQMSDFTGRKAKPKEDHQSSDVLIIKNLASRGILFAKEKIVHSYPHCFRCETPLYYYAIPAWFIKIQDLKPKLSKLNEKIRWIPEHLKEGRFKKSMEGAPDWNISRNRYWASPLPIWKCEKCDRTQVLGSLGEIKEKTSRNNHYILMRHGEAEQNVKNILSSTPDYPHHLTAKGEESVRHAGINLHSKKIDLIIASPFVRTKETAGIIARELGLPKEKVIYDKRLGELDFGDLNGKPVSEYSRLYNYSYEERFKHSLNNGENLNDVRRRMGEFLYETDSKYSDKNILVISHETPLWMAMAVAKGANVPEIVSLRKGKGDVIMTGEIVPVEFSQIPHNADFELDFHRPYADNIMWKCSCDGTMKRISEVVDCWFESGSMPFAQSHYPFEKKDCFEENFPAQFVAEYIAQTRTWFYYSHVISTILFKNVSFENVVTTGTVLAEDGTKMSKSKGNFPDPWIIFNKYGVDALRFYLLSSPLMKSEDVSFSEKGVDEIYKKLIVRLDNVVAFYDLYKEKTNHGSTIESENVLDRWIITRLNSLLVEVEKSMDTYEIDRALAPVGLFVDDLSTWYLRRSRDRFKDENDIDKQAALETTRHVLLEFSKILAPFVPHIAENVYQKVGGTKESVHLEEWSQNKGGSIMGKIFRIQDKQSEKLLFNMQETRRIVSLVLEVRAKANIKIRQPLAKLTIKSELPAEFTALIADEVNVKKVIIDPQIKDEVFLDLNLDEALKGEGKMRELVRSIQELRKRNSYNPSDRIVVQDSTDGAGKLFLEKYGSQIEKNVGATQIKFMEFTDEPLVVDDLSFGIRISKSNSPSK